MFGSDLGQLLYQQFIYTEATEHRWGEGITPEIVATLIDHNAILEMIQGIYVKL